MKTINKLFLILFSGAMVFTSTSCLKDDPLIDWGKMVFVVEMPYKNHYLRETGVKPTVNISFDLMVNYTVPYDTDNGEDIEVSLGIDESMIAGYNKSLGTSGTYVMAPSGSFTLPAKVVIPKGKRLFSTKLNVETSGLEKGKKYIIPVKITGAPKGYTISGNFGHAFFRIDMAK